MTRLAAACATGQCEEMMRLRIIQFREKGLGWGGGGGAVAIKRMYE